MSVVIESTGPVSEARRLLANVVVREALGALSAHLETVRFRIRSTLGVRRDDARQQCELRVRLTTGAELATKGAADSMADAFEDAAHAMRRKIFTALNLPLPARSGTTLATDDAERRAS